VTAVPVAFRSNEGKYRFTGTTQLVNAYAEQMGSDGEGPMAVNPCGGLVEFADTEAGPGRGIIFLEDLGYGYSIHPTGAYKFTENGTITRVGTVPGVDYVQLSRNQAAEPQVTLRHAAGIQVIQDESVTFVTDEDLPAGANSQCNANNRTLYGFPNQDYYYSAINNSHSVGALDFSSFDSRGGSLVRVFSERGEVFGFCDKFTDVHTRNTSASASDEPFFYQGTIERGMRAPLSLTKAGNTIAWVADDNNIHALGASYGTSVLSTNEISRLIEDDASPEAITALSFDREGHSFAAWSGSDWTRCYDDRTKVWHSRKSYRYDRWRALFSVSAWGRQLFQDRLSGKIFYLDNDTFTEDGETMVWQVISPPMHAFPNGGIVDALHLDFATGFGSLGSTPKLMLETSTDGGQTFTQYRELSLGTPGQYQARVTARRLGRFGQKGMVFRVSVSDPVARALVNVDAAVRPLKR
jgi:hypothetical protein